MLSSFQNDGNSLYSQLCFPTTTAVVHNYIISIYLGISQLGPHVFRKRPYITINFSQFIGVILWIWISQAMVISETPQCLALFGGGVPLASSPAFLFEENPNATLERSPATGVPLPEAVSDITLILENPGRGAGEPVSVPGREGAGLVPVLSLNEACGAGTVMKPLSIVLFVGLLASFFLFFTFSVLPLERGCASRNSAACGTALRAIVRIWGRRRLNQITLCFPLKEQSAPGQSFPGEFGTPCSCSRGCRR